MAGLSEENKKIIRMIEQEAIRHGVNPEFAIAIAARESDFRNIPEATGKSTAFGPFQVNKATAKENGIDYEEMKKDPALAVLAGIKNIVRLSKDTRLEGDPQRIAAAHHYGLNSEYAQTGDVKKIDKRLARYLADIMDSFPDQQFPETIYSEKASPVEGEKKSDDMGSIPLGYSNKAAEQEEEESSQRLTSAAIGSLAAPVIVAMKGPGIAAANAAYNLYEKARNTLGRNVSPQEVVDIAKAAQAVSEANAPTRAPSPAGVPPNAMGGKGTYNYGIAFGLTPIEAAKAVDMTKTEGGAHDLTTKRKQGLLAVKQAFPSQDWVENRNYSGLMTLDRPTVPRGSYVQTEEGLKPLPKTEPVKTTVPEPPKETIPAKAARVLSLPFRSVLAGAGAGYNIEDAYQKLMRQNPSIADIVGGILSTGAATASGLSLVPKMAAVANPAAIGLTTTSQMLGDVSRGDLPGMAGSGLAGLAALFPKTWGPIGALLYSKGLNEDEEKELERIRLQPKLRQ